MSARTTDGSLAPDFAVSEGESIMTFTIGVSGHDADADDIKEIFENLVRATRLICEDQASVQGYCSGTEVGVSFALGASDVIDLEAADANDEEAADAL